MPDSPTPPLPFASLSASVRRRPASLATPTPLWFQITVIVALLLGLGWASLIGLAMNSMDTPEAFEERWLAGEPRAHASAGTMGMRYLLEQAHALALDSAQLPPGQPIGRDKVMAQPLFWCWPVTGSGAPRQFTRHYLNTDGITPLGARIDDRPVASEFYLGQPREVAPEIPEVRVVLGLAEPLTRWMLYSPKDQPIPPVERVLADLYLRPIDGRLGALAAQYGPITFTRHPSRLLFDCHVQTSRGAAVYRSSPWGEWAYGADIARLDPPAAAFEPWFTVGEDAMGPDLPVERIGWPVDPAAYK